MAPRIGIAITTYNRRDTLLRLLASLRPQCHGLAHLAVFDDGSSDGSAAAAAPWADMVLSAPNGGIPTNKNRALFYFLMLHPVDQLILLEDDVVITSPRWLRRWSRAIRRHGHINATSPRWPRQRPGFHGRFYGGKGNPRRPERWSIVSGACSGCDTRVLRRHVGYVNPLFQGYGFEHIEWTRRFLRAGYGGCSLGGGRWRYLSLAGDLTFQESQSNRDAEAIARNGVVMAQLDGVGDPVPHPWLDAAGRQAFLAPFARQWAAAPAVVAAQV